MPEGGEGAAKGEEGAAKGEEGAASGAPTSLHSLKYYRTRPARWLRRTGSFLAQTRADLGLGRSTPPVWLKDNPFLAKAGRTETRRLGLLLRLGVAVLVLGVLLLGGLWLDRVYDRQVAGVMNFALGLTFPAALFVVLTFAHVTLIASARTALSVSLADEARRGTLSDLLLSPLRRAEMLLAMGVGPARTALLVALAGLPVYVLLGEIGALSARDIAFLYLLFALLSYAPPVYALPALAGGAMTPDTDLGKFGLSRARAPARPTAWAAVGLYFLLTFSFLGQVLGILRGGWLGHLLAALHLHFNPGFSFFLFFAWPVYAVQLLSTPLDFFHGSVSPLVYGLPLLLCRWVGSALQSASALSAGDAEDLARLPLASRARTVSRWTARAAGLCALGLVWRAWVESGDTAGLTGAAFGTPGADAAGLLLLLGGLTLPAVCGRALAPDSGRKARRSPLLVLRRAFKRASRPLGVAGVTFLLACALGGLSPFAAPVYLVAGKVALVGAVSIVWAVGVRRFLPVKGLVSGNGLLYLVPVAALSVPIPGVALLSALSPATAWLLLFPDAPALLGRFHVWQVAAPPSWLLCLAGPVLVGAVGMVLGLVLSPTPTPVKPNSGGAREDVGAPLAAPSLPTAPSSPVPPPTLAPPLLGAGASRNAARTAALLAWVTARTDNPLFTYELRTRTRSGRWMDWLVYAPLALAAAAAFGLAYPDILGIFAGLSPLHFFSAGIFGSQRLPTAGSRLRVGSDLAALLLAGQCYTLGFRGQVIGEGLIARDRQRGVWGFLLLTPLTAKEIFWGKVWGQSVAAGVVWAACGLGSLLLYALAAPAVGLLPALAAWLVGQTFVAALFVLGLAIGAALSTYPFFFKSGRGMAMLFFVLAAGLGVWGEFFWLPYDLALSAPTAGWVLMAARLLLGIGYALLLSVPLLLFAQWRVADVRRRDIAAGDGAE